MQHFSDPRFLYLDFDFRRPDRRSPRLRPIFTVLRIVGVRPDRQRGILLERTRRGWHVIIKLREKLKPAETVALQACMGSDGRREALNLMRARCHRVTPYWGRRWNILFSGKL
jgi:hypothetical protein